MNELKKCPDRNLAHKNASGQKVAAEYVNAQTNRSGGFYPGEQILAPLPDETVATLLL
jgi:hypothetical protein